MLTSGLLTSGFLSSLRGGSCSGRIGETSFLVPTKTTSSTALVNTSSLSTTRLTSFPLALSLKIVALIFLRPTTPLVLTTRSPSLRDGSSSSTTLNLISSSLTSSVNVNSGFPGCVKSPLYCFRSFLYSSLNLASSVCLSAKYVSNSFNLASTISLSAFAFS